MSLYIVSVSIHVLAAVFWLGGLLFLGLVGAPVLRRVEPPTLRAELFQKLGLRFRPAGWIAIGLLLVTGVANLHFRGLLSGAVLGDALFWSSAYGKTLAVKLVAVAGLVGGAAVHDFWLGPAASRAAPGSPEATRRRRQAALVGRANGILGVVLIVAAVLLSRGL